MRLPHTTNSLLFWMDPSEKFVTKDSNNKIISIVNRVGKKDTNLILPNTVTAPTWVDNSLNGQPTLSFSGAQSLLYNLNDMAASVGTAKPFMVSVVSRCLGFTTKTMPIIFAANKYSSNPDHFLAYINTSSTNTVTDQRITDTLQFAFTSNVSASTIDNNYHLLTFAFDGSTIRLRFDGVEVDTKSASTLTNVPCSLNQICIGFANPTKTITIGSFCDYLVGNVATALAYIGDYGAPLDYSFEDYLLDYYNL